MKILLTGNTMDNYSGQPMSTYESARVLSRDHDVTVVCGLGGWNGNELQTNLEKLGVKCKYNPEKSYDYIIASEWCPDVEGYKVQTVRGITDWESPIPGMDFYSCIRPDVQEHIVNEHGIPIEKTTIIYNGVDRTRFKEIIKSPRDHMKIVAPCNVDSLRKKWLEYLVACTNKERQLYIYTNKTKYALPSSPWVHYEQPTFHMERVIGDADVVVGIYLGRVNLEAQSCHVPSIIYDPFTLAAEPFQITEEEFEDRHNIENTVKRLLSLYKK